MYFRARVLSQDIDLVNKIVEGYEGYGIVSTEDAATGLIRVYVTPDTKEEMAKILADLPVPIRVEKLVD